MAEEIAHIARGNEESSTNGNGESSTNTQRDGHDSVNNSEGKYNWEEILRKGGIASRSGPVSEWKDELKSLLIFIGIFSAVLSGFIILTLPLLRQDLDPTAVSVQLLSQILEEIRTSRNFPQLPVPTQQLSSLQVDERHIVQINILWTCSLGLSLISGFFIISAQQWLRRLTIPSHITLRQAVQLQELRKQGMVDWKVEEIISMLPVLVQLAVILFLAGLTIYINTLHHSVYLVFFILCVTFIGIWVVMSMIPFIQPRCPYKSPAMLAIWLVIRATLLLVGFVGVSIVIIFAEPACQICTGLINVCKYAPYFSWDSQDLIWKVHGFFEDLAFWLKMPISKFLSVIAYSPRFQYWTSQELSILTDKSELCNALDFAAIYAASGIPFMPDASSTLETFKSGLNMVPGPQRPRLTINTYVKGVIQLHDQRLFISSRWDAMQFVGDYMAYHQTLYTIKDLLLECLRGYIDWYGKTQQNDGIMQQDVAILTCSIHRAMLSLNIHAGKTDPQDSSFSVFAELLVKIRKSQKSQTCFINQADDRLPTSFLFYYFHHGPSNCRELLTANDAVSLGADLLKSVEMEYTDRPTLEDIHPYETVLCAAATAFLFARNAQQDNWDRLHNDINNIIRDLRPLLVTGSRSHKVICYLLNRIDSLSPGTHMFMANTARLSIIESLRSLQSQGRVNYAVNESADSHPPVNVEEDLIKPLEKLVDNCQREVGGSLA